MTRWVTGPKSRRGPSGHKVLLPNGLPGSPGRVHTFIDLMDHQILKLLMRAASALGRAAKAPWGGLVLIRQDRARVR